MRLYMSAFGTTQFVEVTSTNSKKKVRKNSARVRRSNKKKTHTRFG
jgi:hypothetical protein